MNILCNVWGGVLRVFTSLRRSQRCKLNHHVRSPTSSSRVWFYELIYPAEAPSKASPSPPSLQLRAPVPHRRPPSPAAPIAESLPWQPSLLPFSTHSSQPNDRRGLDETSDNSGLLGESATGGRKRPSYSGKNNTQWPWNVGRAGVGRGTGSSKGRQWHPYG